MVKALGYPARGDRDLAEEAPAFLALAFSRMVLRDPLLCEPGPLHAAGFRGAAFEEATAWGWGRLGSGGGAWWITHYLEDWAAVELLKG